MAVTLFGHYLSSFLHLSYHHHHVQVLIVLILVLAPLLDLSQPLLKLPLQTQSAKSLRLLDAEFLLGLKRLYFLLQDFVLSELRRLVRFPEVFRLHRTSAVLLLARWFSKGNVLCGSDAHLRFCRKLLG